MKKMPRLSKFREVCRQCGGNVSRVADTFGVSRQAVYGWAKENPEYMEAVNEWRMRLFDECVVTARMFALGIPDVDPVTKKVKGWKERPNAETLKFLMRTLGRHEGFVESLDVTSNGQTIPASFAIEVIDSRDKVAAEEDGEEY